jgi:hypothetical protein
MTGIGAENPGLIALVFVVHRWPEAVWPSTYCNATSTLSAGLY